MTILVTGARGQVGRNVLAGLLAAGAEVRASSREADTLELPAGVGRVDLDLEDPDTIGNALDGVRALFLYVRRGRFAEFVKAAHQAGVERVVLLSSSAVIEPHADVNPIAILHRAAEQAVRDSGLAHTILHPWAFATNALGWVEDIRTESTVHTPYPDARIGAIHEGDIANVVVKLLLEDTYLGEALSLSGPESISIREQVEILGEVLGRPLAVRELTLDEARERMPFPEPVFDSIMRAWAAAVDVPVPVTGTVEAVTGTAPRGFREWAVDHRGHFLG